MALKLYYCRGDLGDGETLDGFITAPDPKVAEDVFIVAWGGRSELRGEFPEGLRIMELPGQIVGQEPEYLDWDKLPETVVRI